MVTHIYRKNFSVYNQM